MKQTRLSKAQARIVEQCWKLETCSCAKFSKVLPEEERVAHKTVQTCSALGS